MKSYYCRLCGIEVESLEGEDALYHLLSKHLDLALALASGLFRVSKDYRCWFCDLEPDDTQNDEELLEHLLSEHFELVINMAKGLFVEVDGK